MSTPINMSEPVRLAEIVPANLRGLRDNLRKAWNTTSIWDVGDQMHDCWYHRSRAWILQSGFSRFGAGDSSIQGALNQGGDANWVAALDFALSDKALAEVYGRLEPAMRAGLLPQLAQLIKEPGHGHLSFYRSRANDDHTLLYQIMTGQAPAGPTEVDMFTIEGSNGKFLINGRHTNGKPIAKTLTADEFADFRATKVIPHSVVNYVNPNFYEINPPPPTIPGLDMAALGEAVAKALKGDPEFVALLTKTSFDGAQLAETK